MLVDAQFWEIISYYYSKKLMVKLESRHPIPNQDTRNPGLSLLPNASNGNEITPDFRLAQKESSKKQSLGWLNL